MKLGLIARLRRWRATQGGVHRSGAQRTGIDAHPALSAELETSRQRLADVEDLAPRVDQRAERAERWLSRNHLGPLFEDALGLGPGTQVRGRKA